MKRCAVLAGWLAIALLAGGPAWAQGADGPDGTPGGAGGNGGDGGGGGAGQTVTTAPATLQGIGGDGGFGGNGGVDTGMGGATAPSGGKGGDGGSGVTVSSTGGPFSIAVTAAGGSGGDAGDGAHGNNGLPNNSGDKGGQGGAGGAGGTGVVFSTPGATLSTGGSILGGAGGPGATGGSGGKGGNGTGGAGANGGAGGDGGDGGAGGIGIIGTNLTINNQGTIRGGAGGAGGSPGGAGAGGSGTSTGSPGANGSAGTNGSGGEAIKGSGLTITNSGTLIGGMNGDGVTRANAITFTGGANSLEIDAGSTITGNVVVSSGTATLTLGGPTNSSFNASSVGSTAQYQGFTSFTKTGSSTWTLTGTDSTGINWTISAGTLQGTTSSITGSTITDNATLTFNQSTTGTYNGAITGTGSVTITGGGTVTLANGNNYSGGTTVSAGTLQLGTGGSLLSTGALSTTGGTFDLNGISQTVGAFSGTSGSITNSNNSAAATFTAGDSSPTSYAGTITGNLAFTKQGSGTLTLTGANTYTGGTTINAGTLQLGTGGSLPSTGALSTSGGTFDLNGISQTIGTLSGTGGNITNSNTTTTATLTVDAGISNFYVGTITGNLALTKQGSGVLTLDGANTYTGGTTISVGGIALGNGASLASTGALSLTGTGSFNISSAGANQTIGDLSGVSGTLVSMGGNTLTVGTSNSTTFAGVITGTGGLVKQGTGTLTLGGANTYTGATTVAAGTLFVTGSVQSAVTVDAGATVGGTGSFTGGLTVNGNIRPDIGTTNVVGPYVQGAGSTYTVEVTPAGLSDRIAVTGSATISNTASVSVMADAGTYQRQTTYTILTATTGVFGTYGSVTSNLAFLTPTLSYDAHDVFLTLLQTSSAFQSGGVTSNQKSVGAALDKANPTATGDFNTVLNALSLLSTAQGPAALDAIGGVNYAGFSTLSVQSALAFMNGFANQAGQGSGGGGHIAMAKSADETCDFSCEPDSRWGMWGGGVGGLGTIAGDSNTHSYTYNLGGFAAGLDYKLNPSVTIGVTAGYTSASLWTSGLSGRGTSDQGQVGLYGQFKQNALYVDGLVGYAHAQNDMTRPIVIPGLAQRIAFGQTTADQAFGLLESGYKVDLGPAFVTPFARLQGSTATQAAFTESGAQSLDLNVQQQTTNSLRTALGAQVGGTLANVDLRVQAGWSHEYADTSRPVTASFAGAPAFGFTTQGAAAPRDGAIVGFAANAHVADGTSLYARYDGDFEGGTTSHIFSAGLRMTW